MNLPIELKTRIYEHIGLVQQHLGDLPADEMREFLQPIETHIHDALAVQSDGEPTMAMLEAIIAEMDPPESYGSTSPLVAGSHGPTISSRGKILLYAGLGILCALFGAIWLADPFSSQWMGGEEPEPPVQEPSVEKTVEPTPAARARRPIRVRSNSSQGIVGKWTAIDFVSNISDFHPRTLTWDGELAVQELQFFKDGTTNKDWWTWKDDQLIHSGDKSAAGFMIAQIGQKDYLFLEWLSGDVTHDKQKPKYYVFRRGGFIDPEKPKVIQEGVGWGALRIGATRAELIAEFGEPDSPNSSVMAWNNLDVKCSVSSAGAHSITFFNDFDGATAKGIKIGSTEEELLQAYGKPEQISYGTIRTVRGTETKPDVYMRWPKQGVHVTLNPEHGVTMIEVHQPVLPE